MTRRCGRHSRLLCVAVLALAFVTPPVEAGARASNGFEAPASRTFGGVPITVGAGWSATTDVPPAFFWSGPGTVFSRSGPFTFTATAPVAVRVTDAFCRGDRFRIWDIEDVVGETTAVAIDPTCSDPEQDPDIAFADPTFSSGTFILGPGFHSIAIQVIENPFEIGQGYIRVDSAPPTVPLPTVSEEYPGLASDSRTGSSIAAAGNLHTVPGEDVVHQDFITGAPGFQGGTTGAPVEAGAVAVFLGSDDAAERAAPDIIFVGEAAHDRAGVSVAGNFDFDGDGIPDLLIGAEQINRSGMPDPNCPSDPLCGPGKVYLIYFDPANYPNIDDPTMPDIVPLSQVGVTIPGAVFVGASLGDQAGFAVAAGGPVSAGASRPEVAIGAPGVDWPSKMDAGAVYLVFNNANNAPTGRMLGTFDLSRVANGQANEVDGIVYQGAEAGDRLGFSVAFPGDVVDPAGQDLAMGAPLADPVSLSNPEITQSDAGIVFVASGGTLARGIIEVCAIGEATETAGFQVDGVQIRGDQAGEQAGYSVAGGGDNLVNGHADLLGGSPFYDVSETGEGARLDAGRGFQTAGSLERGIIEVCAIGEVSLTHGIEGAIYTGQNAGDRFGTAVAGLGDVTSAAGDDIAFGAPHFDPSASLMDAGIVYLVEATTSGNLLRGVIRASNIGVGVPGRGLEGTQAGEEAGYSAAGIDDFDGDGLRDFATGSPGKSLQAGAVSVVTRSAGLPTTGGPAPPTADASRTAAQAECDGAFAATVVLDGSASTDPNSASGNDDIVLFEWFEGTTALATGEITSVSLGLGSHTITLRVTDSTGLTDTDEVTVIVADTVPPRLTVSPVPNVLWPPNHRMVRVDVTVVAADDCDPAPTVALESVTSSEPDDAPGGGDGHTVGDIQGVDAGADTEVFLRAERAGSGPGRVYTLVYSATDHDGLGSPHLGTRRSASVVVPHSQGLGSIEPLILRLDGARETRVSWEPVPGAWTYDVVRGRLDAIHAAESLIDLGPVACVLAGSADTTTAGHEDTAVPMSGEVFFYVAQFFDGLRHSSYGTESAGRERVVGSGACP